MVDKSLGFGAAPKQQSVDKHKQSNKSADEKVYFEVEQHFVDDYQHYPAAD